MDPLIKELSDQLAILNRKIRDADPWEDGYGELLAIYEHLLGVLNDKANADYESFCQALTQSAAQIEKEWAQSGAKLSGQWLKDLQPIFATVEKIIGKAVPLLLLLL